MKKSAFLAIFLIVIIASAGTYAYFYFTRKPSKSKDDGDGDGDNGDGITPPLGLIIIYVESTIYSNITAEIEQYKQDIITQGYTVKVYNWTQPPMASFLKNNLTLEYAKGLIGAILVGNFPYEWFNDPLNPDPWGPFPCDLFLMDLDGTWLDNNPFGDGVYDGHTNTSVTDLFPEIWIARINPSPLSGRNQTKALKEYFKRNHEYRTGILSRPHKGLLYIDNDWSSFTNEWVSNFTAYTGANLEYYYDNSTTNPTHYKNNLTRNNLELVHLLVHSNETDHLFGMHPVSGFPQEGVVNTSDIKTLNTQPLFYNLYACYTGDYSHPDSLGTQYLFSNNSLVVICGSRSGGMDLYQPFYDALNEGKTFGDAFKIWWHNPDPLAASKWAQRLWYGMTIFGDPLLTIYM